MSLELTVGREYEITGSVATFVPEQALKKTLVGRRLSKITVTSVVFGDVEKLPFRPDRKGIVIRFKVNENPLPIAMALAILIAATGVLLSGSLVIKNISEVIETTASKSSGALILGGIVLGGIALAKGRI